MAEFGEKLGKLSLAILENFVEGKLGKKFVDELRAPTDRLLAIETALRKTESLFVNKFDDADLSKALFIDLKQADRPLLKEAVGYFFDHPTDPSLRRELYKLLFDEFQNNLSEERIDKAVDFYIKLLTQELMLADEGFRVNISALSSYNISLAQQRSNELLEQIATAIVQQQNITQQRNIPQQQNVIQSASQPLKIFLCHSSWDKPFVRDLYEKLTNDGFQPWLDEKNILPGQDWEREIRMNVRNSDVVIVCLSNELMRKAGYVHKEIKYALDTADEQPDGTIFIIPLKIDQCEVPERLQRWQWVNFFNNNGYDLLKVSLVTRLQNLREKNITFRQKLIMRPKDLKMIVVDADTDWCKVVKNYIELLGYQADTVNSMDEMIKRLRAAELQNSPYSVVIMELIFPTEDRKKEAKLGPQILKSLRDNYPYLVSVILTALRVSGSDILRLRNQYNIAFWVEKWDLSHDILKEMVEAVKEYIDIES